MSALPGSPDPTAIEPWKSLPALVSRLCFSGQCSQCFLRLPRIRLVVRFDTVQPGAFSAPSGPASASGLQPAVKRVGEEHPAAGFMHEGDELRRWHDPSEHCPDGRAGRIEAVGEEVQLRAIECGREFDARDRDH
jgi:hypothetical protein